MSSQARILKMECDLLKLNTQGSILASIVDDLQVPNEKRSIVKKLLEDGLRGLLDEDEKLQKSVELAVLEELKTKLRSNLKNLKERILSESKDAIVEALDEDLLCDFRINIVLSVGGKEVKCCWQSRQRESVQLHRLLDGLDMLTSKVGLSLGVEHDSYGTIVSYRIDLGEGCHMIVEDSTVQIFGKVYVKGGMEDYSIRLRNMFIELHDLLTKIPKEDLGGIRGRMARLYELTVGAVGKTQEEAVRALNAMNAEIEWWATRGVYMLFVRKIKYLVSFTMAEVRKGNMECVPLLAKYLSVLVYYHK